MFARSKARKEYSILEKAHFSQFKRGDLVFVKDYSSLYGSLISLKAVKDSGSADVTHVERYIGDGRTVTQDLKVKCAELKRFFNGNYDIYVFSNNRYSANTRNALVAESMIYYGISYDIKGVFGQLCSLILGNRTYESLINSRNTFYCSEFIYTVENMVLRNETFPNNALEVDVPCTPDQLYDYLVGSVDRGWEIRYSYKR